MSAPHSPAIDTSSRSAETLQDISLGSLPSFSSPGGNKLRVPSTSSQATAFSNPPTHSSPQTASFSRRKTDDLHSTPLRRSTFSKADEDGNATVADETTGNGDMLDSSVRDGKVDALATPMPNRTSGKRKSGKAGSSLTLRDQEKHIDSLKKENFNIKLKVHFLEERLAQLAPDHMDAALKQNIHLKIQVQQLTADLKKHKKLALDIERTLDAERQEQALRERDYEERIQALERECRDLRRRKGGTSSDDDDMRERYAELELRNEQLEDHIQVLQASLEETNEELEKATNSSSLKGGEYKRLQRLETDNQNLRAKIEEQAEILANQEDEREELLDEIERVKVELEDLTRRRDADVLERSQSRAQLIEEREEREAIVEGLNELRDKLAAAEIELSQKDDELDLKNRELEDLEAEHERIVDSAEQQWREELQEAQQQVEELRDVLAERDADSKELRIQISELEASANEMHVKFETALAHLERESEEKDAEIESANREIEKLGQQVYDLEDELEHIKEENARTREDEAVERERLETLVSALKEKVTGLKAELEEGNKLLDQSADDINAHLERQEELAQHVEALVEECRRERDSREKAESTLDLAASRHESELRNERRAIESKESALQSALSDLARAQALLNQREADVAELQSALRSTEAESRKLGESATTDRFSLQLEVDRLKRDLERVEQELTRVRAEVASKEAKLREKDDALDKVHAGSRELTSQLAAQTQARLNIADKLDLVQSSLRTAETEVAAYKSRVGELEQRLSKDQRSLISTENQYRDQLTERNTLLLTIFQYMEKILGAEKGPKKVELKPFSNFSVFHDNLIAKLKALSQIQLDFEKRCKEAENRYSDKLVGIKKQMDHRWRQLDKFEASLKTVADTKLAWKRKFSAKEGELEALKATNAELSAQLSSLRRPAVAEASEVKSLQTRAANAERRLANAQNQLLATEEKMAAMNQKTSIADGKWEARVKEYEVRLKQAEERVKKERQGAKERVAELEGNIKTLHRQIDLASKRNQQLSEVIEAHKPPNGHN